MSAIEQELVQKSQAIFDSFDKWSAFLELEQLRPSIRNHWLAIGTKNLREHFKQNPSRGWRWEDCGGEIDTRWYLEEFGRGSLSIGFGWFYEEFHLHLDDPKRFDSNQIDKLLKQAKYAALSVHFDSNSKVPSRPGSMASRCPDFTFINLDENGSMPVDELAWYAANRTETFVKEAACIIERFTRDKKMTRLLYELNAAAEVKS